MNILLNKYLWAFILILITVISFKYFYKPVSDNPQVLSGQTPSNIIFGIGPELDQALQSPMSKNPKVKILTSWYNGPNDLKWIKNWKNDLVPDAYSKGYALHLVVFSDYPEKEIDTEFGKACGRPYPVSKEILSDMKTLAETFKGGKLYVTLFTEFQTYPCSDNAWVGSENYYKSLKDNYLKIKDIFHAADPNTKVALSWGGWQTRWDDPGSGGGKSMFKYFDDVMKNSDFEAFQAMQSDSNINDIKNMTEVLGKYNKGVMVSHYKPDNSSQDVFNADMKKVLTESYLKDLENKGLFAFSFMDEKNIDKSEEVKRYFNLN